MISQPDDLNTPNQVDLTVEAPVKHTVPFQWGKYGRVERTRTKSAFSSNVLFLPTRLIGHSKVIMPASRSHFRHTALDPFSLFF